MNDRETTMARRKSAYNIEVTHGTPSRNPALLILLCLMIVLMAGLMLSPIRKSSAEAWLVEFQAGRGERENCQGSRD